LKNIGRRELTSGQSVEIECTRSKSQFVAFETSTKKEKNKTHLVSSSLSLVVVGQRLGKGKTKSLAQAGEARGTRTKAKFQSHSSRNRGVQEHDSVISGVSRVIRREGSVTVDVGDETISTIRGKSRWMRRFATTRWVWS